MGVAPEERWSGGTLGVRGVHNRAPKWGGRQGNGARREGLECLRAAAGTDCGAWERGSHSAVPKHGPMMSAKPMALAVLSGSRTNATMSSARLGRGQSRHHGRFTCTNKEKRKGNRKQPVGTRGRLIWRLTRWPGEGIAAAGAGEASRGRPTCCI